MPKNAAGKHFSSKFRMARHEAAHKDEHEESETPEFEAGEEEGSEEGPEEGEHEGIEEVVAQHGPAHEIHIEHNHEEGKHTVKSHHGEHVHEETHSSAEEAHLHAAKASGVEPPMDMGGMGGY